MINHPFVASPDDPQEQRELQATYYGMMAEVDDQLGRILDALDETGLASRTLVVLTSDHGETLGDHWMHAQARLVRPDVPRAAHRPRPARAVRRDARPRRRRVHRARRRAPDDRRAPRRRGAVAVRRPAAHSVARRRDTRRLAHARSTPSSTSAIPTARMFEGAFGLTLEECSLAVLRDDHGKYVHFSGHPTMPPIFFDLDADPAQVVNRAADPEYAADGARLRAAHARLAHAPRRTHAHRHEAHRPQGTRRAPRAAPVARQASATSAASTRRARATIPGLVFS